MTIRRVQPNDIFPVIALAYHTLPERYNPAIFNYFYEECPEGFLVALKESRIIGFLIGIHSSETTARILMLSVEDSHRKQGIGSALFSKFLEEMRHQQVSRIELEVRTTNQGALAFYTKKGFRIQGILKGFYQNGQHAYSMIKTL
ncbi:MAG: ribosomal protein S18-alanine N-acetyltransferase [Candidatus Thermoplasmatota archaeon]|nr:ribosomal protein S18-alanine N-acetyltransferase [Candidatus Thermoplasmatota archaeon]